MAVIAILLAMPGIAHAQDTLVPPPTAMPETGAPAKPTTTGNDLRPRALGASAAREPAATPARAEGARKEAGTGGGGITQTIASLGMVLGLILAIGAGARKLMRSRSGIAGALNAMGASPSPAGILDVLGRYPLSRGTSLVLLKVDRRVLLLVQPTPGPRMRGGSPLPATLCEITDPDDVASIMIKSNEAEGR
jgi:flagellar biogenesis protein FliO